jgi:hypothetical protein
VGTTDDRGIYTPSNGETGWGSLVNENLRRFTVSDGFEWEKWSTSQSIPNHTGPSFGGLITITGWESTPNIGSEFGLQDQFNPTTGVFTPAESGWYIMSYHVQFEPNAMGWREGMVTIVHAQLRVPSPGGGALDAARIASSGVTYLDGPDNEHERFYTGSVQVRQTSGGNLNVTYAAFHIIQLSTGL